MSSSPALAIASASQSRPPARGVVDQATAGTPNITSAHTTPQTAPPTCATT